MLTLDDGMFGLVIGIVGAVATIASLFYASYLRNHPRTDADVRYAFRNERIAPIGTWSKRPDNVGVTFKGVPVDFVDELQIAFRNYGPSRVNVDDVETPITIDIPVEDGIILDIEAELPHKMDDADRLTVNVVPMQKDQTRIVRVLHNIPDLDLTTVKVSGEIKRLPNGLVWHEERRSRYLLPADGDLVGTIAFTVILVIASSAPWFILVYSDSDGWDSDWRLPACLIFALVCGCLSLFLSLSVGLGIAVATDMQTHRRRRKSPFGNPPPYDPNGFLAAQEAKRAAKKAPRQIETDSA